MAELFRTLSGTEEFQVIKSMTVDGIEVKEGDMLPHGIPIRDNWRRLETMVRTRHIRLLGIPKATIQEPDTTSVPQAPLPLPPARTAPKKTVKNRR